MLRTERHTPQNKNMERRPGSTHPPAQEMRLPPVLYQVISAQSQNLSEALAHRVPSLYGFCNKVLIHVNLWDYCVQQYSRVPLFPL